MSDYELEWNNKYELDENDEYENREGSMEENEYELGDKVDKIIEEEGLTRWEGEKGVQNLARLCRCIGYKDSQYFGQFSHKASYGDLIQFLEDNSGAVEALVEWIRENEDAYDLEGEE